MPRAARSRRSPVSRRAAAPQPQDEPRRQTGERGFSLMEAVVATVIAVIAVLGLAYSFGLGRGFIDRFEAARVADGLAAACMDSLATTGADLSLGGPRPSAAGMPIVYAGTTIGRVTWTVSTVSGVVPGAANLVDVAVTASWTMAGMSDSLRYQRFFRAP